MTIEDWIKNIREVAEKERKIGKSLLEKVNDKIGSEVYEKRAEEHEQLASWLEELVILREAYKMACANYVSESQDYCYDCCSETCTHQCKFYNQCGNSELAESYFIGCANNELKAIEESSNGRN